MAAAVTIYLSLPALLGTWRIRCDFSSAACVWSSWAWRRGWDGQRLPEWPDLALRPRCSDGPAEVTVHWAGGGSSRHSTEVNRTLIVQRETR